MFSIVPLSLTLLFLWGDHEPGWFRAFLLSRCSLEPINYIGPFIQYNFPFLLVDLKDTLSMFSMLIFISPEALTIIFICHVSLFFLFCPWNHLPTLVDIMFH